ncbi:MAG: hypothetical protein AB7D38_12350 [Sulfurimonas sp.]|uniref:hypothetical protein n=1 Tax=Sulfurimonas sp. TaxID=2022749 RepID=UPI003D14ACAB
MNVWCATFDGKPLLFLATSFDEAVEKVLKINKVEGAKKVSIYQNPPVKYLDRLN